MKRWKKLPRKQAPTKPWDEDQMKVIGWCMSNNINIGITPDFDNEFNLWQIEIRINGTTHIDPKRYDEDVLEKVYEYYKYYYHKYNTNKEG
jgi:hypothetical protein|tara:strand:+ start:97 stop:369 length:273 start_codon:yes stop_codon:yes gene_type:complete